MKLRSLGAAVATALLVASAANAASTATQTNAPAAQTQAKASNDSDPMKSLGPNNLRQQIHAQLDKAGYTSIKITPSSFYVQAKDKKGDPVAMVIGPDSFTEVTEIKPQSSAANAPQPQGSIQQNSGQQTQQK